MELTPVKFLSLFLVICSVGWILFSFAAKLIGWLLSRTTGALVSFRIAGFNCVKDISIQFKKGALKSLTIGGVRLKLYKPFRNESLNFTSWDLKLQFSLCDVEIVLTKPLPVTKKLRKVHAKKHSSTGRGKWMIIANVAKYLRLSASEILVKFPEIPMAFMEMKAVHLDMFKGDTAGLSLGIKFSLMPCVMLLGNEVTICEESTISRFRQTLLSVGRAPEADPNMIHTIFSLEQFVLTSKLEHDRETGLIVRQVDATCGDTFVNLSECLSLKNAISRSSEELSKQPDKASHAQPVAYGSSSEHSDSANDTVTAGVSEVLEDKLVPEVMTTNAEEHVAVDLKVFVKKIPQKVNFSLPKLQIRCSHLGDDAVLDNEITGFHLQSSVLMLSEESPDIFCQLDIQLECGEIHVFRENDCSLVQIMKVAVAGLLEFPAPPNSLYRAEVDVRLGGTQCNVLTNRFEKWMQLNIFKTPKKETSNADSLRHALKKKRKSNQNIGQLFCWVCSVSAPEMTVVVYSLDGLALFHVSSQTSHLYINSVSGKGAGFHIEVGELYVTMADEEQELFKHHLSRVETIPGCVVHIGRAAVDWGLLDASEEDSNQKRLTCITEIGDGEIFLSMACLRSLMYTGLALETCAKLFSAMKSGSKVKQGKHGNKKMSKGVRFLKFHLEGISMEFRGILQAECVLVPDPKKVNFGNQGGEVVITKTHDGKLRTASVKATTFKGTILSGGKCKILIDLPALHVFVDRDKDITQLDLERGKLVYHELDNKNTIFVERTLFGLQNVKFVVKPARVANETRKHSILSATEITAWWEPDVHLFFNLISLQLKQLLELRKSTRASFPIVNDCSSDKKMIVEDKFTSSSQTQSATKLSWWKTAVAVDIEVLRMRAELADGVEGAICIQSIFSEDAEIGILFEDVEVSLNNATVVRNERLQISRVPVLDQDPANVQSYASTTNSSTWDCIVQGTGTHIVMPYRLPIRAIDDAVEDMWRGLKLALAAQAKVICPEKATLIPRVKKERSMHFSSIKFHIHDITAEIEEEPIQGWLDEHQRILRKVKQESLLRERLLEEEVQELHAKKTISPSNSEKEQVLMNGQDKLREKNYKDLDLSTVNRAWETLHQQTFQAYRNACAMLVAYRGSGACSGGYQGGFCPSQNRGSLFSVHASNLDLTLTKIDGGRNGMINTIRKLDCVAPEMSIPFARVLGRHIDVSTSSLIVQLRDYSSPMLAAMGGKCKGVVIFAQQATCFPKQMAQELYIGRWRKVEMLRSISGSTPSWKMYSELPISFHTARVSFGVGFEPAIADVSYAFTVALRRADLSVRKAVDSDRKDSKGSASVISSSLASANNLVKRERSLPWWDDMRYYVHGKNSINAAYFEWSFLATTDPYENVNMMRIYARPMIIEQSEGRLTFAGKDFDLHISSTEAFALGPSLDLKEQPEFIHTPVFLLQITMDWDCSSGEPHNHYLHAFPKELEPREKVYDLFRSTSLALGWNFSLTTPNPEPTNLDIPVHVEDTQQVLEKLKPKTHCTSRKAVSQQSFSEQSSAEQFGRYDAIEERILPSMNIGAHDLIWIFKWWSLFFSPPHKLRSFSRWPRFGIMRLPRSGNLSLDKVLTEFILRVDATPACIKHISLMDDDPAEGLTFNMRQLRYELCYSRGRQHYTFDSKRDLLELVYQGVDVYSLIAQLDRRKKFDDDVEHLQKSDKVKQLLGFKGVLHDESTQECRRPVVTLKEHGFLFKTDCFTVRKQAPKADPTRLSPWRENVRVQARPKTTTVLESGSDSGSEPVLSDPSDDESFDESFNVVLADNCLRVSLYGLKLFWTIPNRDAVWAWVGDISRAFESPKPSPSRQYVQRKMMEEKQKAAEKEVQQSDLSNLVQSTMPESLSHVQPDLVKESSQDSSEEEGTLQFMVNVIQPQFNLHSEDAHGRFLLAAASGRVLARSFHSIYYVGLEMIEQALGCKAIPLHGNLPQISWKRRELSVLLENVQAHVAPTDVDPGAGLQWLPRIPRKAPDVKRTGALLERVFMPCTMYFQYTRHKGGTTDCKVKPLKELSFNSPNIAATMTSCQFHIMVDVISNLLLARLPKPRKDNFLAYGEKDEVIEEEADEVVPDGVEEVEQARIRLEQAQRECKLLFDDLKAIKSLEVLSGMGGPSPDDNLSKSQEGYLWMISSKTSALIRRLETDFAAKRKARKVACVSLRISLQSAAQQRLMEKEKNKSPSAAMRISWAIDKVVWSMLSDGELFAEAEISSMILNVDRGFDDIGVARFTVKSFVAKNCLPSAKSNVVLSAWNPPKEWGRNVMLRVDAKQGAQKEGSSPLELFEVEIYPLKIHLTEIMYTMMWEYFFPEEGNDSQKRQVWRIPTAAAARQSRKGASGLVENVPAQSVLADVKKESEYNPRPSVPGTPLKPYRLHSRGDISHVDFSLAAQPVEATGVEQLHVGKYNVESEHRRSSSFDRMWEENDAYILTNDIILKSQNSNLLGSLRRPDVTSSNELQIGPPVASDIGVEVTSAKPKESRRPVSRGSKVSSQEEKKEPLTKKSCLEFYNIKISQVELLVTYEGSRVAVSDLRLLMDTFTRAEFIGSWRRLFSRVKKHIIWSVLKSVAGMQGKKFKDKLQGHGQDGGGSDSNSSDSCASTICNRERFLIPQFKRQSDRAGEGFVSSIKGLFNSQRRKAKALVRRTMRGEGGGFEFQKDWSDGEAEIAQIARQLSRTKAKQLLRRHTKKIRSISRQKGVILLGERYRASPRSSPYYSEAELSSESSAYEDFND
ncbi:hypothetical protein O6H91_02G050400 [Diphasiastrum complanatum]|uniref:Uncharacterized protein n=1 Tax=Diphasiastrum complanatum TaxID=34168 RepID=A0ACC2EF28_DIPCM|nr:hypothetical protein O6H91_02G050400 [Diphasiastrum complanatum]